MALDPCQQQLLHEEKGEVVDFVQPNLNQESAGDRPGPSGASPYNAALRAGQPVNAAPLTQEILPPELWPHNFLMFSIILAVVLGIMNPLTLPLTLVATALGVLGQHQSKRGKYSAAKFYSKITITLLFLAVLFYGLCFFIGLIIPAILIPAFAHRYSY